MSEESRQELKPCPGCGRMRYKRNMSPDGFCMICASIKARADSKPDRFCYSCVNEGTSGKNSPCYGCYGTDEKPNYSADSKPEVDRNMKRGPHGVGNSEGVLYDGNVEESTRKAETLESEITDLKQMLATEKSINQGALAEIERLTCEADSKPEAKELPLTPCYKCGKIMDMTPVCSECGIIPIAESSFSALTKERDELESEVERLKAESKANYRLLKSAAARKEAQAKIIKEVIKIAGLTGGE